MKFRLAFAAGATVLLLGSAVFYWQSGSIGSIDPGATSSAEQWITVEPQAVTATLDITGTISAGRTVPIVAPFDGVIREKRAQLGDFVKAGDVLVVMDSSEITTRYRDAQSAYLKAQIAYNQLDQWDKSPDVTRARRSLESAQNTLAALDRQVSETKALLDKGIVSRNEYDGLAQRRDMQKDTVNGAQVELADAIKRGNDDNRKLAELELENTKARMADVKQQMAGAKVATAIDGILIRPPLTNSNQSPVMVEPGATVTRGGALFAVADTSSFVVNGAVDEVDINKLKIGQPTSITSDAFQGQTISGKIVGISAEASPGAGDGTAPKFQVRAAFTVRDEKLRSVIRIGMSARMTIETYSNPQALLVPPVAVTRNDDQAVITIMYNGKPTLTPIILGQTFPSGIEVAAGINAGDVIALPDDNKSDREESVPTRTGPRISSASSVEY